MKIRLLTIAILLTFAFTTYAQPEIPEACTEAAQAWYDDIDSTALETAFVTAAESDNSTRVRFDAVDVFRETAEAIATDDDVCFVQAVEFYADGLNKYADAMDLFVDDDFSQYVLSSASAYILIGQMRGYMAALGVELADPEDNPLYFK